MYRIRIFSNFCESDNCKDVYERLCEAQLMENYGEDKEVYITNGNDFTHVIILNTAMPQIAHIPKQNVIGFAFEPVMFLGLTEQFVKYAQRYIGKYYIGDKYDLPEPFVERFSHMWHNPPLTLNYIPEKNRGISIMISEKKDQPGHKHRHDLVKKILESGLPVDIYGRGCVYYEHLNDPRVKGKFTESEPYEHYDFHIAIENFETNHYFSEKITNALLCQTTPIYLGCRSIDEYFPDMVVQLSGDVNTDWLTLFKIVSNPEEYKKVIDLEKVKNKVSLFRNLDQLFCQ
jgi:hypothetical protein